MTEPSPEHPPIAAPLGSVTTARLDLRPLRAEHRSGLAPVFAKPEVWQYPLGRGFTRSETEAFLDRQVHSWATRGFGLWLAVERSTNRAVGFVGLSVPTFLAEILPAVEVGWRLDPDAWGKGYATEGARAALDEAFTTLGLAEVCSIVQTENIASMRVAERAGLRQVRTIEVAATEQRGALEAVLLAITRDEWVRASQHPTVRPRE